MWIEAGKETPIRLFQVLADTRDGVHTRQLTSGQKRSRMETAWTIAGENNPVPKRW
jgi:hypothetical protein